MTVEELFDLTHTKAAAYLKDAKTPWSAVAGIKEFLSELIPTLGEEYREISEGVWAHVSAKIAPTAYLGAPCVIGANTEIRHCAYIRGSALIGDDCVVGNSVELKNVILFDRVQVPHFNYVGDSILGYKAHMGAGSIVSNVKSDKLPVRVRMGGDPIDTGMKKLGAIVGDCAEIGCNSVLNPGTIVGRNASVYPVSCVRGYIPPDHIYKAKDNIIKRK